jgi:aquaporin related protein
MRSGRVQAETSRDRRTRHEPFSDEHAARNKHKKWKTLQQHLIAASGEFCGTFMFLWFAFAGTEAAILTGGGPTTANGVMLISLAFGFSLLVNVWAFYRISGGLFNPAVLLAMCITGNLPWIRAAFLFPAELLGSICASALIRCMYPGAQQVNFGTTLGNGTSITQGVFIEMFLTALLVFTILMLAAEKHYATFMAPVGIGLALFVAMMAGVSYTGASLNPARSFGPAVAAPSFPSYHYIYWFGPIMGALLAAFYYKFVKYFNYEEANPGQDAIDPHEEQAEKRSSQNQ